MEITTDDSRFDDRQNRFVGVILREVVKVLESKLEIDKRDAVSAGEAVTFAVTSLLDGARTLSGKNRDIVPHLTFSEGRRRKSVVTSNGASSMHEYVHGWTSEMFSKFTSPVILHRDLPKIPIRPRAALALRSLHRGLQLVDRIFKQRFLSPHAELVAAVDNALHAIATSHADVENPLDLMSVTSLDFDAVLNDLRPGSPERSVFLSACEGAKIASSKAVNDVLSFLQSMGSELPATKRDRLEHAVSWPAYLDFKLVEKRLEVGTLNQTSCCDPDSLGELWLKYEPSWNAYV